METLAKAMQLMEANAQKAFNGTGEEAAKMREEFNAIGISGNDLVKLTPTEKLMKFADALHQGALAGKDFALAKDLMSRGGPSMIQFLGQGSESIKEEADSMRTFSTETVGVLKGLEDQIIRIKDGFVNAFGEIAAKFGMPMLKLFTQIQAAAYEVGGMIGDLLTGKVTSLNDAKSKLVNAFIDQGVNFDAQMRTSANPGIRPMPEEGIMPAPLKNNDNKLTILADALQKVGGGGQFARIGGQDYNRDIYGGLLSGKFKVKAEIVDGMAGFGATQGAQ
jgi:hypothetical protein